MIYQKDWLMRQIESMIAAILHFLTHSSKQDHDVQISQSLSDEITKELFLSPYLVSFNKQKKN